MLITLNSLSFRGPDNKFIFRQEYAAGFQDAENMNIFIIGERKFYEERYGRELSVTPFYRESIRIEDILTIFKLVGDQFNLTLEEVLKKTKKEDNVTARWYAMKICYDRGLTDTIIASEIGYDRNTVRYGRNNIEGEMNVNNRTRREFNNIMDIVLCSLNGEREEDGSGKKIEQ